MPQQDWGISSVVAPFIGQNGCPINRATTEHGLINQATTMLKCKLREIEMLDVFMFTRIMLLEIVQEKTDAEYA